MTVINKVVACGATRRADLVLPTRSYVPSSPSALIAVWSSAIPQLGAEALGLDRCPARASRRASLAQNWRSPPPATSVQPAVASHLQSCRSTAISASAAASGFHPTSVKRAPIEANSARSLSARSMTARTSVTRSHRYRERSASTCKDTCFKWFYVDAREITACAISCGNSSAPHCRWPISVPCSALDDVAKLFAGLPAFGIGRGSKSLTYPELWMARFCRSTRFAE